MKRYQVIGTTLPAGRQLVDLGVVFESGFILCAEDTNDAAREFLSAFGLEVREVPVADVEEAGDDDDGPLTRARRSNPGFTRRDGFRERVQ